MEIKRNATKNTSDLLLLNLSSLLRAGAGCSRCFVVDSSNHWFLQQNTQLNLCSLPTQAQRQCQYLALRTRAVTRDHAITNQPCLRQNIYSDSQ